MRGIIVDFVNDFDIIISDVSGVLGKSIDKAKYEIIDRGIPNQPRSLPTRMMGSTLFGMKASS